MYQPLTIRPRSGFPEIALSVLLILTMTWVIPQYFKTWLVEPTGKIQIAPAIGPVLSMLLLFRVPWSRIGALLLGWSILLFIPFCLISAGQFDRPGYWLLAVLDVFLLYLLYSERVKSCFTTA